MMRHRVSGRTLGRPTAHRIALFRNLTRDLIIREAIVTTEAKAKEARTFAEKMITLGKDGSLASRRKALAFITDKKAVGKVFNVLSERYEERQGGYTRITKIGPRRGDAALMVRLELV
jgi:large subunit ribosomal protein L17